MKWTSDAMLKERMDALSEEIRALHEGSPLRAELIEEHRQLVAERHALEPRAPYNLRHSYVWHCQQADVPIATLARQ